MYENFLKRIILISPPRFETGLSDHDKLKTTILRKTICKSNTENFYTEITRDLTKRNLKLS